MITERPKLVTFAASHFCEKARWALDCARWSSVPSCVGSQHNTKCTEVSPGNYTGASLIGSYPAT